MIVTDVGKPPLTIFAHAYYPDVWREMARRLEMLTLPYQLVLTSPYRQSEIHFPANAVAVEFRTIENRGRDIRPFLVALRENSLRDRHLPQDPHEKIAAPKRRR